MRLTKREIEPLAPSHDGMVRVNHESDQCHGESDSLKIERKDGKVSAICFRCGAKGFYYLNKHYVPPERRFSKPKAKEGRLLPDDVRANDYPSAVAQWLAKSGQMVMDLEAYGALWSDEKQTFYIPVRYYPVGIEGFEVEGYVCRRFNPKGYSTLRLWKRPLWGFFPGGATTPATGTILLVEDVLSGLKLSSMGYDTIALCGTELHPEAVSWIVAMQYKQAVVWLDGDNPTVRMKGWKMKLKLAQLLDGQAVLIETGEDPKNHSPEQIHNQISKAVDRLSE